MKLEQLMEGVPFALVQGSLEVRRIMYTRPIFLTRQAFNCFDAVPCTGLLRNIIR